MGFKSDRQPDSQTDRTKGKESHRSVSDFKCKRGKGEGVSYFFCFLFLGSFRFVERKEKEKGRLKPRS